MNQLITEGWQIAMVNKFLKTLLDNEVTVEFKSYTQYNSMISDIMDVVDGNLEYLLDYGKTKKGYNTFKIKEIYEAE